MAHRTTDAWPLYDAAWQLLLRDEIAARRKFTLAHDAFAAAGDHAGAASCAAAALIGISSRHADFLGLGLWLERFDFAAIDQGMAPLRRLRAHVARICLASLDATVGFQHHEVVDSAAAVYAALRSDLSMPEDERILYARLLLDYWELDNDPERFRHVAALLQPSVDAPGASPYWAGVWWWRLTESYSSFGDAEAAAATRERAWTIAETHHIADLEYAMLAVDGVGLLVRGDLPAAARKVARMNTIAPQVNPTWRGHGMVTEARMRLIRNEPELARSLCIRALHIFEDTEVPQRERDSSRSVLAQAHVLLGDEASALALLEPMRANQTGGQLRMLETIILATHAARALRMKSPDFEAPLASALAKAREIEWYAVFFMLPEIAARLFEAALARDIEREFVIKAIRSRGLAAPDPTNERWPWAVRLRALGSLVVERDGEAIAFERKAQRKPLELLKALVAAGGDGVPRDALALALWPDPDADALVAFDVTLSRLRKLVDVEGALLLTDGKLSLNRRIVWCDAFAFELLCAQLSAALTEGAEADAVEPLAATLFGLYRDKLYGDEPAAPWSVAARERLALRFDRAVADVGAWLETHGLWRAAIDRYESGLAQQMLAEPFYRGLMRCHHALGESTEALLAYRRCRELLSVVLGVKPSAETEKLHRLIRGD